MYETKFTPGPWTFENWVRVSDGGDCPLYIKSKNGTIADMNFNVDNGIGSAQCTANAKLIAAAPELYDVLKEWCADYEAYQRGEGEGKTSEIYRKAIEVMNKTV